MPPPPKSLLITTLSSSDLFSAATIFSGIVLPTMSLSHTFDSSIMPVSTDSAIAARISYRGRIDSGPLAREPALFSFPVTLGQPALKFYLRLYYPYKRKRPYTAILYE